MDESGNYAIALVVAGALQRREISFRLGGKNHTKGIRQFIVLADYHDDGAAAAAAILEWVHRSIGRELALHYLCSHSSL